MITQHDIQKLANLARIEVSDTELETLQKNLEHILLYVDQLNRAETGAIEPLKNVMGLENSTRSDNSDSRIESSAAELLEAAPASQGGYVKVPAVKNTWS